MIRRKGKKDRLAEIAALCSDSAERINREFNKLQKLINEGKEIDRMLKKHGCHEDQNR